MSMYLLYFWHVTEGIILFLVFVGLFKERVLLTSALVKESKMEKFDKFHVEKIVF